MFVLHHCGCRGQPCKIGAENLGQEIDSTMVMYFEEAHLSPEDYYKDH